MAAPQIPGTLKVRGQARYGVLRRPGGEFDVDEGAVVVDLPVRVGSTGS